MWEALQPAGPPPLHHCSSVSLACPQLLIHCLETGAHSQCVCLSVTASLQVVLCKFVYLCIDFMWFCFHLCTCITLVLLNVRKWCGKQPFCLCTSCKGLAIFWYAIFVRQMLLAETVQYTTNCMQKLQTKMLHEKPSLEFNITHCKHFKLVWWIDASEG